MHRKQFDASFIEDRTTARPCILHCGSERRARGPCCMVRACFWSKTSQPFVKLQCYHKPTYTFLNNVPFLEGNSLVFPRPPLSSRCHRVAPKSADQCHGGGVHSLIESEICIFVCFSSQWFPAAITLRDVNPPVLQYHCDVGDSEVSCLSIYWVLRFPPSWPEASFGHFVKVNSNP